MKRVESAGKAIEKDGKASEEDDFFEITQALILL